MWIYGSGSSPFQYEMESVQLRAEIDLKSIYGLKSTTPFKIHLTEQWALINVSFQRFFCLYGFCLSLSLVRDPWLLQLLPTRPLNRHHYNDDAPTTSPPQSWINGFSAMAGLCWEWDEWKSPESKEENPAMADFSLNAHHRHWQILWPESPRISSKEGWY